MEKHSRPGSPESPGDPGGNVTRRAVMIPIETQKICNCAEGKKQKSAAGRVCNLPGCTTVLSIHNHLPFCSSCRKANLTNLKLRTSRGPDYDGLHCVYCNRYKPEIGKDTE